MIDDRHRLTSERMRSVIFSMELVRQRAQRQRRPRSPYTALQPSQIPAVDCRTAPRDRDRRRAGQACGSSRHRVLGRVCRALRLFRR